MEDILETLERRGLLETTSSQDLKDHLKKPCKVYAGFDPTADSLHLGNFVGMVVLRWFQKAGHSPVVVLGGATGRIGDPSGKSSERPLLDPAMLAHNIRRIRTHFEEVLDFFHSSAKAVVVNNDEWWQNINSIDFLRDIGRYFRVGAMLGKESVRARLDGEEGLSFTEFSYQVLQGFDFCHLFQERGVTLQIGGSDQWGNITAGIELARKSLGKQLFGLTFPLLTRSDGKKFGKSEEGAIWLAADRCSPYELYQYLYRVSDQDVFKLLRMITFVKLSEIESLEASFKEGSLAPNEAQKKLAIEVTKILHGDDGIQAALQATEAARSESFSLSVEALEKAIKDLPHAILPKEKVLGAKFQDLAAETGFLSSKGEASRLIRQGGAYINQEKILLPEYVIEEKDLIGGEFLLLGAGKKNRFLIRVS